MSDSYIDFHCHPSLKPFGKSFTSNKTKKRNSPNRNRINSIYHRQGLNPIKKKLNNLLTLTKFTQSDFTSVHNGSTNILVVSLYPMEKNMILDKNGVKFTGRLFRNLATGISLKRIRYLQKMKDYFEDLQDEYNFYKELDSVKITKGKQKVRYKIVSSYSQIRDWADDGVPTIFLILSIEGCHVFNTGLELAGKPRANKEAVLANINTVKDWIFPPFFVGLTHHFDNELCGHEKSMGGLVDAVIKQEVDPDQGITPLGYSVIDKLLEKKDDKKRILIDIKHMNVKSRYQYYELIKNKYNSKIPIIVSHGAVNGMNYPKLPDENGSMDHNDGNNRMDENFNDATINFYDDEVFRIARSRGIFGIQLDERRIADKKVRGIGAGRNKSSKLIWRQIEHMAKYLDNLGMSAWNIQCLGTDFDGIIDPLPGFWTSRDLDYLPKFLRKHANEFLSSERGLKMKSKNRLSASEIVQKFMFKNAQLFLMEHFK